VKLAEPAAKPAKPRVAKPKASAKKVLKEEREIEEVVMGYVGKRGRP